jgi:mannose-6-phosphate isomerase-like protein (cupin superfamily)
MQMIHTVNPIQIIDERSGLRNGTLEIIDLLPGCSITSSALFYEKHFYVLSDTGVILVQTDQEQKIEAQYRQVVMVPCGISYSVCSLSNDPVMLLIGSAIPNPDVQDSQQMRKRVLEDCMSISKDSGVTVYELTGLVTNSPALSLAFIEIASQGSCSDHYYLNLQTVYVILEGNGEMMVDGKMKLLVAGDVVPVLFKERHQIFNPNTRGSLKFLSVCFPAWRMEEMVCDPTDDK